MASDLDLTEILQKVKTTSFRDDESVISEREASNGRQVIHFENSIMFGSKSSSEKSHITLSSVSRTHSQERQGSTGSRSTVLSSEQNLTNLSDPPKSDTSFDLGSMALPPRTTGHPTRYESSRSSSSSRHSSAKWSGTKEEAGCTVESLFDNLITMSALPTEARCIIESGGLDTLVATMYPESCLGCGTMPLGHVLHPAKRHRKSQSMKAISDIYRNLEEAGSKHSKVHRYVGVLVRCLEGLMDTYMKLRTDPDTPLPTTQPLKALIVLSKLSFHEDYRTVMNDLGVIFVVTEYVLMCGLYKSIVFSFPEHTATQVSLPEVVKYGCATLTNLTCGDQHVKTALSHLAPFLETLLALLHDRQLPEPSVKIIVSLFRNLSWRASSATKQNLAQVQVCSSLLEVGMRCSDPSTMKIITSTLWNLSAHNTANKEAICSSGLKFLAVLVNQPVQRNTAVLENALGVLRNISSHIAQVSHFRRVLREAGVLPKLTDFLRSDNDTIVVMSCGALWNLSARSPVDQEIMRQCGALSLLNSLALHPDKTISKSASGALRNISNTGSISPTSRSISPSSREGDHVSDHAIPPSQFWLDDYSLISSNDSRSRASASPKPRRKVEGRQTSKHAQKLRFASQVDKFSC